ncbi:formimidoylglutamate deiminase [uncultured Friedmanniella sp.]|uniref:formimidoylglutamate deiminase n=1 Tax=uncultured Friedmanniella sp. TaxID=335381 RepID=UPI0035CA1358
MTTYWCAHAQLPTGLATRVRLSVHDGHFTEVTVGTDPQPSDERLTGVVLPGMANAHSHAFHRALRGQTHGSGGTFWTWREGMYAVADVLDPDLYLALARALYAEMVLAGITAVGEFHYLHHGPGGVPYADPNAMGHALIQAATEAGIRLTLLDTCCVAGGLGADGHLPLNGVQQRFSDGDVESWAVRVALLEESDQVRIGAAAHSVRAVPEDELGRLATVMGSQPLHVHLSEQPAENLATQAFYGCSPTELLGRTGLLGPRTTAVHATHLSDADITILGGTATCTCLCPTTERDLADGIGPARRLHDEGSPLSLGTDQHAVIDFFEEMRGLEMHERLLTHQRGCFSPEELLHAASAAGYEALGWAGGGRIAAGAVADFVSVREDSVRTTGCAPDQIIYAATAADVDRVVVGGRTVVSAGKHHLGAVAPLIADALDKVRR